MTTQKPDPGRWAVSKGRNRALAQPLVSLDETPRFQTMSHAIKGFETENEVLAEVEKLWAEAQEKFLTIGRYLVQAKQRFHRTYEASILPLLPFGKGVAFQLRAVATAVDEGRLLEEEMPRSYATAYQLVSLTPRHFDLARKENLVRPDVLRREVNAFKVRLKRTDGSSDPDALRREKLRLQAEAKRITLRLEEIEAALA